VVAAAFVSYFLDHRRARIISFVSYPWLRSYHILGSAARGPPAPPWCLLCCLVRPLPGLLFRTLYAGLGKKRKGRQRKNGKGKKGKRRQGKRNGTESKGKEAGRWGSSRRTSTRSPTRRRRTTRPEEEHKQEEASRPHDLRPLHQPPAIGIPGGRGAPVRRDLRLPEDAGAPRAAEERRARPRVLSSHVALAPEGRGTGNVQSTKRVVFLFLFRVSFCLVKGSLCLLAILASSLSGSSGSRRYSLVWESHRPPKPHVAAREPLFPRAPNHGAWRGPRS
jgi:hypothetical protein